MKSQILYVLVSRPADCYYEQALVSATTARRHNPDAKILLLTDPETEAGLDERPQGADFKKLFDQIIPVPFDAGQSPMIRSRLLKTGMRNLVDGDFLYIDTDTLIMGPLDAIDDVPSNLAACTDLHAPSFAEHPHYRATCNLCRRIGYDVSKDPYYFNGGVLLVRDTPENHEFFKNWQENYKQGLKNGIKPDQPSFAKTSHGQLDRLPDIWNCEIQSGVRFLRDARIVHYMCTNIASGEEGKLFKLNAPAFLKSLSPEVWEIAKDPFKGLAPMTRLFAGEDLLFFQTRRYRYFRGRFKPGKWSLTEWLLKVRAHLLHTR